ncbi:MAG: exo-alpha-sialidase, partial [Bacteroidota bacterium]
MKIYSLAFLLLFPFIFSITDNQQKLNRNKSGVANIVFKSTDGGQTWQDISKGLPESLQKDAVKGNSFFANDKGLFIRVGNGLYHNTANATAPFWTKEIFPYEHSNIATGKSG